MDAAAAAAAAAGDDPPRAKFLCSFGGSIIPRPLDGRLRYVGGETRIVSLPRDVTFDDLLSRMRELFDSDTVIIKYHQPDEDLDALVSVVNDDDVVNMMEEYDKLAAVISNGDGSSAGLTRLRIFLFSHNISDPDIAAAAAAAHFDVDERESERRYVDALNRLSTSPDISDQYFGAGIGLHQLNIPHPHSQHVEGPWSPAAYFSQNSPSVIDQQSPGVMETMWIPPGGVVQEKAGFPGNLGLAHNVFDGRSGSNCEHCRTGFVKDPRYVDYMGHYLGSCGEYYRGREMSGFYNEGHGHDRGGWMHHPHQHYVDGSMMNANVNMNGPFYGHGNFYEGHGGTEFGGEMYHGQQVIGHGDHTPQFGMESTYHVPPNLPPIGSLRRKAQVSVRTGLPYESAGLMVPNGFVRGGQEGSPRLSRMGPDEQIQNPWVGQDGNLSHKFYGVDDHSGRLNPNIVDAQILVAPDVNIGAKVGEVKEEVLHSQEAKPTQAGVVSDNNTGNSPDCLNYLPELVASLKNAVLEGVQEVKARAEENVEDTDKSTPEVETGVGQAEPEVGSDRDGDQKEVSKIESTTAEAEALAQGLQTIRNDDLEEIRELGSGTYGSVYYGKWRGSDVAIKRIKASCFNGKPSERERLIADFWKEALTLSSLHHPNVVSLYGVVRDGPDGSLATVTEFMVNGSLKQFLQKKDRTIDRRKRLIIAMDAAFGMEYLHGKNIVHFDLKCENLLVNMRDPQRPICKIGDLGLSKVKQRTLVSGGVRGTIPWMAPELLSGKNNMVTEKVDVYSFGIVMWELLTGEEPYGDMHCGSIIGGIMSHTLRPKIPSWCDPEWKALMESCWSSDPGERPSFSDISQKLRKMAAAINVK